jgi:hypothetical protein
VCTSSKRHSRPRSSDEQLKHWADTLRAARSANVRVKARVSAAQAQRRQDSADAAKWARYRQAEAVWRVLQLEASDQGCKTEGQARAFAESGVRIRRLRGKLDEMRRMAAVRAAKHRRNRPILTSRGSQLGIDRGMNQSMRATDYIGLQPLSFRLKCGANQTETVAKPF